MDTLFFGAKFKLLFDKNNFVFNISHLNEEKPRFVLFG